LNTRPCCFTLITLCTTRALLVALSSAVLFTSAAVAFAAADGGKPTTNQESSKAKARVFTGLVTDDRCGGRHDMDSGKSTMECTKMCVRNGSKYVLVEGDKKYELAGNESALDAQAGQRVKIVGSLEGNTIKVTSINSGQ
jgi:hypothetical protein